MWRLISNSAERFREPLEFFVLWSVLLYRWPLRLTNRSLAVCANVDFPLLFSLIASLCSLQRFRRRLLEVAKRTASGSFLCLAFVVLRWPIGLVNSIAHISTFCCCCSFFQALTSTAELVALFSSLSFALIFFSLSLLSRCRDNGGENPPWSLFGCWIWDTFGLDDTVHRAAKGSPE